MRSWQTLGAPDDPNVWSDLLNFWPTPRGTYEVSDGWDTGVTCTATGETTFTSVTHAFVGATPTSPRAYLFTDARNWELTLPSTLTDRTNAKGGIVQACQFGNTTIGVRGTGSTVVSSTGGNFADLAGSPPNAALCAVAGNVVGLFNTSANADGWATCDLNTETTWTPSNSNKAASGRLLGQAQGPITAACTLGKDFIVFKRTGIYRGTYVGGDVKWLFDIVSAQFGCGSRYGAVDCGGKIVFVSPQSAQPSGIDFYPIFYVFDGLHVDRLNPVTEFNNSALTSGITDYCLTYEPRFDLLIATTIGQPVASSSQNGIVVAVYSFKTGQWGKVGKVGKTTVFLGEASARSTFFSKQSALPPLVSVSNADEITLYPPEVVDSGTHSTNPYIQTSFVGQFDAKHKATRVTPVFRRKTDLGSGSLAVAVDLFRERHDTSAASSPTVTASASRTRFDFTGTDNYARAKLTATDMYVEIDDLVFGGTEAGKN